ncbi:mitochondrial proton/calcium exchanger protein-like protein isoform X1 [Tanacetum coccineum]
MTRSLTKELFTPFKDPEREFRSSRKHFKTLSLDESRSLYFNLFSDQEEYSEEEVAETMAETMEQYMSKTRADYGSGVARLKIEDKDNFELKGQLLKELCTNTFSGSDHEDANEHIEKVFEIMDLFHIPHITIDQEDLKTKFLSKYCPPARTAKKMEEINNFQQELDENLYQAWERFKELLMKCPQNYLTEMQETVLFYNGLDVPTRQILDSRGAITLKTAADAKVAIQEMAEYSQKWHNGISRTRSTKTSDGLAVIQAQLNNLGREIKKMNEKVYAAQVGCEQCKVPHCTKDCPLKEEGKTLEEAYYTQFDTLSKFMSELAKRHEENSNLIKEIRASTDAAIRNQGASIKTLEIQIGQIRKVLQERGFGSLPSSTETNLRDQVKSISTIVEVDSYPIRRMGSFQYAVSTGQNHTLMYETKQTTIPFPSHLNGYYYEEKKGSYGPQFSEASHINNSIPRKEKDPGSFTLPCFINNVCFDNALADLGASICVMPLSTYFNLGLGELAHTKLIVELADRTVKYPKRIAENVLVRIGKFVFPVDFIILDMPEDIKVPLILGRTFLSTAQAKIDVFKRKITLRVGEERIIFKSVKPSSSLIKRVYMLSLREIMELNLEAKLMGETLGLNRSLDPFFEDYIELKDLNVPLDLKRDQVDDLMPTIKEGDVVKEFRTRNDARMFSCMIDFAVLEDMDAYRNEGMCDVILGEPFLREVGINAKWFDGMMRSHLRFKNHTNEQCNKILPLLKDLAGKKSTMLVENLRSGNLEVLES